MSSEAQARELRVRARRRLIGALALVLAAVIVVPMLFDPGVPEDQQETPVVVPAIVTPAADAPLLPEPSSGASGGGVILQDGAVTDHNGTTVAQAQPSVSTTPLPTAPEPAQAAPRPSTPSVPAQTPPPASAAQGSATPAREPAKPEPSRAQADRTDDGSVALALMEGRKPAASQPARPAAAQQGNFVLQIAAYTSQQDAGARRDKLVQSGVTNAYVETAQASGRTTYRLRVGPFSTREAAQAAQTRIRALGDYKDAFITSK